MWDLTCLSHTWMITFTHIVMTYDDDFLMFSTFLLICNLCLSSLEILFYYTTCVSTYCVHLQWTAKTTITTTWEVILQVHFMHRSPFSQKASLGVWTSAYILKNNCLKGKSSSQQRRGKKQPTQRAKRPIPLEATEQSNESSFPTSQCRTAGAPTTAHWERSGCAPQKT